MAYTRKYHRWKDEALYWRGMAYTQMLAISAVANDKLYECRCGDEPYTDGEMCPACFCIYVKWEMKRRHEETAEATESYTPSGSARHRIQHNIEASRKSQESKVKFVGPTPFNRSRRGGGR